MKRVAHFADLIKYKLSVAITFSAVTGYFISGSGLKSSFILLIAGIFLLSSGAAALNQFTEKESDASMERTRLRPIPASMISPAEAFITSMILLLAGETILFLTGIIPAILGALSVFLYNLVYTKLKRVSLISVIPGALVGAIPPVIGFSSAGGVLPGNQIIMFSAFMFLWQLPHFWLILIRYGDDYRKAGFKTFSADFSEFRIRLLVFGWVIITTFLLIAFSVRGMIFSGILNYLLIFLNLFFHPPFLFNPFQP
jgi:protoheme IX farnesyltransferase